MSGLYVDVSSKCAFNLWMKNFKKIEVFSLHENVVYLRRGVRRDYTMRVTQAIQKKKEQGCFMKKLLPTEFEKMCLNCGAIELKSKGEHTSVRYDRVKVVLHPNRVCLLGDSEVYCIEGVKYILQHTNAPCCFDVVSRELDNDYDTIYKLVINKGLLTT